MEKLSNSSATSTSPLFFIGIGLTAILPNNTSAASCRQNLTSSDLFAIERIYNPPMQFSTDEYVETTYKMKESARVLYNSVDFSFMDLTQQFAQKQVVLDNDFTEALDELLFSKINNQPTKRRF